MAGAGGVAAVFRPRSTSDLRRSNDSSASTSRQPSTDSYAHIDKEGREGREEISDDGPPEPKAELCLRINVRSVARYRLCDANPQDEAAATWAVVTGVFQQSVLLRGHEYECDEGGAAERGEEERRLVVSDRVVTVDMNAD